MTTEARPEIAFYYPNPFWFDGSWIKNLILFFDGVGLLVPDYMKEKVDEFDPAIVAGLKQHGLLHIISPETLVDRDAAARLAEAMTDVLVSGALDQLTKEKTKFAELSYSRLGGFGDKGLAGMLHEELMRRGLAKPSEDGGTSIPMHPAARSLILVLLAQILREPGRRAGLELSPATDQVVLVDALHDLLALPKPPTASDVIAFDVNVVGVDLGPVPMGDVLDFRHEHAKEHQRYVRSAKLFAHELSLMPDRERQLAFEKRQQELDDLAAGLRKTSRKAWKRRAGFALTMVGATVTAVSGHPLAGLAMASGALLRAGGTEPMLGGYSYLFSSSERFR